jgi:hypothetical protein
MLQNFIKYIAISGFILGLIACSMAENKSKDIEKPTLFEFKLSGEFKSYWYAGQAEISSYQLSQARYGEMRTGEAVLVFVTEPFSKNSLTKADQSAEDNVPVLKCNTTRRFNTGIYPYSLMTSTFYPIEDGENSLKATHSMQEWCGHVFMEFENIKKPKLEVRSYFQGENQQIKLSSSVLEDDFWSKIRLNPTGIKQGKYDLIPSFAYLRFSHILVKAYAAEVLLETDELISTLSVNYPELERILKINFNSTFPYQITSWSEESFSGFGADRKKLVSTGKLLKTIKSDYWNKHDNIHEGLRDTLLLRL